jgi:hypothetical protein
MAAFRLRRVGLPGQIQGRASNDPGLWDRCFEVKPQHGIDHYTDA